MANTLEPLEGGVSDDSNSSCGREYVEVGTSVAYGRCGLGLEGIVPHSVVGPLWFFVLLFVFVWAGSAVGSYTGELCWPLLAGVWRAIAPLVKPWCG